VAAHVIGFVPPAAASVALYAVPTTPPGSEAVVMTTGPTMVIDRFAVAVRGAGLVESVAVKVAVDVPAVVGLPVIWPVDVLKSNPAGRLVAAHVIGLVPPVAARVALYAVPTTPPGSDAVVIVIGPTMVIDRFAVAVRCVGLVASVAVNITVDVIEALGVPVIWPVAEFKSNPAGRPVAAHVIGFVPPVAATVTL
jgi:hypothetical protein